MPRQPFSALDTPTDTAGDADWRGFRSKPPSELLPPGIARESRNMRLGGQKAQVRAGSEAIASDVTLSHPPVVVPFDLPTELAVASLTRVGATATVTTGVAHGWSTGDFVGIEGAAEPGYNGDWQITVTASATFTYALGAATPATPATGTIVAARGPRVFETYSDRVRTALAWVDAQRTERLLLATGEKAIAMREGEASVNIAYPAGHTIAEADQADLVQYLGQIYLFRGRQAGPEFALASLSEAAGLATATAAAAHNLATGNWVWLRGATPEAFRGLWQITVTGATTFTFAITGAPGAASVPGVGWLARPPLVWNQVLTGTPAFAVVPTGGPPEVAHLRMPPADWALEFNRQLIVDFGPDEHIQSDFGVAGVYDTQNAQLRIRPPGGDWLVAVHPGPRVNYLALYRKSLHRVQRNTTDLAIASVDLVPGGLGCAARRTVVTCGDFVAWLGDAGVHMARFTEQMELLTIREPLSTWIQDFIERINWAKAHLAVAAYHDNAYHLAVPLDGSATNNAIFRFNFQATSAEAPFGEWESVDVYPGDFDATALCVISYQGRQRLHAVTAQGYAYALGVRETDQYGAPGSALADYDIEGVLRGRRLTFGSLERKRYLTARVDIAYPAAGARVVVGFKGTNPDSSRTLTTVTALAAGDATLARRVGAKAVAGAIDLTLPAGRPIIKSMTLEAAGGAANSRSKE